MGLEEKLPNGVLLTTVAKMLNARKLLAVMAKTPAMEPRLNT